MAGDSIIDKTLFDRTIELKALSVEAGLVAKIIAQHKGSLWHIPRRRPVIPDADPKRRIILFKDDIPASAAELGLPMTHSVHLSYEDASFEEVMRRILPLDIDPPGSFESIGHIAHFNLRDELLPFGAQIGQALLDKHGQYRTVLTKIGTLSGAFRTFPFRLLAGDSDFEAEVKEGGFSLVVPFTDCYWNSRLSGERVRLLEFFKKGDTVIDMFAGVGGLAVMAGRKGCKVYANDLNPAAVEAIKKNSEKNKIDLAKINCGDGRDFVRNVIKDAIARSENDIHFIMNLPEIAIDFLNVFPGLINSPSKRFFSYTHCFARANPPEEEIAPRVMNALGLSNPQQLTSLNFKSVPVRDVAPNKIMYCVQLQLTPELLSGLVFDESCLEQDELVNNKKLKLDM